MGLKLNAVDRHGAQCQLVIPRPCDEPVCGQLGVQDARNVGGKNARLDLLKLAAVGLDPIEQH